MCYFLFLKITCGASREIGLFDVRGENYISRFVTKTTSNVTCVITDAPLFTVGCQDGSIRLFDTRVPSRDSLVRTLLQETESGPVVSIARVSPTEVVSATAGGSICYWDTNSTDGRPFKTIPRKKGISAFAAHQKASVLAYSSARPPKISVCTRSGEPCKKIKSHDGFLGQRISPLTDLVFHPHNIMLAASFSDSLVCIYSLK